MKTVIRRHRLLLASLAFGASALVLSYVSLAPYVRNCSVVIASRDLESFVQVRPGDVAVVQLPAKIPAGAFFSSEADVVGTFTRTRVVAGQILLSGHVVSGRDGAGLSYDLPADRRGFFLPVPATKALGGVLKEGERVDVVCASKGSASWPDAGREAGATASTVLRDVPVVEVVRDEASKEFMGVMVFATIEDCETLAKCLESSNVYLCLAPRTETRAQPKPEVWPTR